MKSNVATEQRPINVLFILNSLCMGGAEKQVVSLINRIDARRYGVALMYLKDDSALLGQVETTQCAHGISCLNVAKGIEWHAVRKIAEHIDERGFDVVLCTNMYALLYGWLAQRLCKRKFVSLRSFTRPTSLRARSGCR